MGLLWVSVLPLKAFSRHPDVLEFQLGFKTVNAFAPATVGLEALHVDLYIVTH